MFVSLASMTSSSDNTTDAELVEMAIEGDRDAAGELVSRYHTRVRLFLLRLCGNATLADDLAQDTFVRMLRYLHRYDSQYAMQTWLMTIARRLWINHITRKKKTLSEDAMFGVQSDEIRPDEQVAEQDDLQYHRERINKGLLRLSEAQRQAIILFHQQELPIQEVAEVMEVPVGTVKSHLHRARATLRTLLTDAE